nr:hypothetical transcript [Hymenolepis microstoma]
MFVNTVSSSYQPRFDHFPLPPPSLKFDNSPDPWSVRADELEENSNSKPRKWALKATVERRPEVDNPSIDNSQKAQDPGTNNLSFQNEVQMTVQNTPEPTLRSSLRNREGRSASLTTDDDQQQMRDSLKVYNMRTPRQVPSSHHDRPNSQDDLTGPQAPESIEIVAVTHRMTCKETQTEDF